MSCIHTYIQTYMGFGFLFSAWGVWGSYNVYDFNTSLQPIPIPTLSLSLPLSLSILHPDPYPYHNPYTYPYP